MENGMFYGLADYPAELSRRAAIGSAARFPFANIRALKKFTAVLIVASAVSACTGGAGLDIPMRPVDHGCHTGAGVPVGAEGSGCS
jgi:hypothetical protein